MIIISALAWAYSQPIPPSSGGSGPQPGYAAGLFIIYALLYGGAYAVVGLPFILLGAAFPYQRRGVAS